MANIQCVAPAAALSSVGRYIAAGKVSSGEVAEFVQLHYTAARWCRRCTTSPPTSQVVYAYPIAIQPFDKKKLQTDQRDLKTAKRHFYHE